jgi:hypothetical protein
LEIFKNNLILIKDLKEISHHKMRSQKNQVKRTCNMAKEKFQHSVITRFPQTTKLLEAAQTPIHSKSEVPQFHSSKLGIQI